MIVSMTSRSIQKYSWAIRFRSPTTLVHGISGAFHARLVRYLCGSLTDHDQVVKDRIARLPIELSARDMGANGLDRLKGVTQSKLLLTTHKGTASASARSRTSDRSVRSVTTST